MAALPSTYNSMSEWGELGRGMDSEALAVPLCGSMLDISTSGLVMLGSIVSGFKLVAGRKDLRILKAIDVRYDFSIPSYITATLII